MNGAAAVPDRNTSTPNMNRMTTIGSSHHFLLCFRNCQNSVDQVAAAPLAGGLLEIAHIASTCSELPKIVGHVRLGCSVQYEATASRRRSRSASRPISRKTSRHRREHQIEQSRQHHACETVQPIGNAAIIQPV